jgi:hypothetical protein
MMAVLNWCYGAKTPDLKNEIEQSLYAAHKYRNDICRIELDKRRRHYQILRRFAPEFVRLEKAIELFIAELESVRKSIQRERVLQRTKTPTGCEAFVDRAAKIKSELKTLRAELKIAKKSAYENETVKLFLSRAADRKKRKEAELKKTCGLYWGTEAITRQACGSFGSGAPPRFTRYTGEGQLAVQIQGGLDCDEAGEENTLCYLDSIDDKKADCYFRIASENGRPVFAKIPIVFHRPLPEGRIKWAYLERRKIADHVRWNVRLTIDVGKPVPRDTYSWVAIHVGWRMIDAGLRVAVWQGSDGKQGEVVLPNDHLDDYLRLDEIKSRRDLNFNDSMKMLIEFCKTKNDLPDWLEKDRPHLSKWKTQNRLAALVTFWRDNRFDGDDEIYQSLESWRKPDKHAWQNFCRLSKRVCRRRTDWYRKLAKQLSDRYGVLYWSKIDAGKLSENTTPEELGRDDTTIHRHSKQAAVFDFVRIIREKFPLHDIETGSPNMTRQCANCGEMNNPKKGKRLHACVGCGKTWDIDDNALANTIARGEVLQKTGGLLAIQEKAEENEKKQAEKLLKMQDARREKIAARKQSNESMSGSML